MAAVKERAAPSVIVHIEALDLSGVPRARRPAVAAAFVRELEALLRDAPPSGELGSVQDRWTLPPLPIRPTAPPERVGAALARALHGELRRPGARGGGGGA